jgi:hypothetical protein
MGRSLPIAMQYGERLVLAPYQPLSSGFLISEIERLLSRLKQTTAVYFLCADKQQLAANNGHTTYKGKHRSKRGISLIA